MNQNPVLKETEARYPECELQAIHDDITLIGPPAEVWGEDGCLAFLIKALEDCGHTVNLNKCSALGSTPSACDGKPDWLKEPTTILDKDSNLVQARASMFVRTPLEKTFMSRLISFRRLRASAVQLLRSTLALKLPMRPSWLSIFSFQSRFDYWLATNYLIYTDPLAASMDVFLHQKFCDIAGFDIFSPQSGVQAPDFT